MLAEKHLPDYYYDDTDLENLYEIPIRIKNPTWKQKKEIELLKTMYRGVMLVTGKPRQGKDLFGTSFSYLNKFYFGRPIMLDFKPKRLFGEYIFFDPRVMLQEINKMAKAASLNHLTDIEETLTAKQAEVFSDASKDWLEENETRFQNVILYLSELKRYCYNRNPHNRMNKFIGQLCTIWGHLDMLIIGTHVQAREIDQFTFLHYVTHWVNCAWSLSRPNTTCARISRGTYLSEQGMFDVALKPFIYNVDGGQPRDMLGGKRFFDLYNSKNMINLKPVVQKETAG